MKTNEEVEQYLHEVERNIQPPSQRTRFAADLRAHIQAAIEAGESPSAVLSNMGSPQEVAAEFMSGVKLRYASKWHRLAAFVIDILVSMAAAGIFAGLGVGLANLVTLTRTDWSDFIRVPLFALAMGFGIVAVGIYILYFPILEGRFGQTVGKRILGLRVVKENGAPIGFKEAFLRRLPFYFRFGAVDALFIFFTAKRQRAFDIIARTVVIEETT